METRLSSWCGTVATLYTNRAAFDSGYGLALRWAQARAAMGQTPVQLLGSLPEARRELLAHDDSSHAQGVRAGLRELEGMLHDAIAWPDVFARRCQDLGIAEPEPERAVRCA